MEIKIDCPQCTEVFTVPESMRGGVANCPKCRKLVEVPSATEFVFWGAVGCASITVLGIGGLLAALVSPLWGGVVCAVGLGIIIIVVMCL